MATTPYKAIAQGIASLYAPGTITPPSGQPALTAATEQIPSGLAGALPIIVVFPPDITNIKAANGTWMETHDWPVRLYVSELVPDYPTFDVLFDWMQAIQQAVLAHVQLTTLASQGLSVLKLASAKPGILTFGSQQYLGVEHHLSAQVSTGYSATA